MDWWVIRMNYKTCKEQIISLIQVLEESFNVKENPITDYAVPILKTTLDVLEAQRLKIQNQKKDLDGNRKRIEKQNLEMNVFKKRTSDTFEAAKNNLQRECDEAKVIYFDLIKESEKKRQNLEAQLDEIKLKYFNETAELQGQIEEINEKIDRIVCEKIEIKMWEEKMSKISKTRPFKFWFKSNKNK